MKKKGKKYIKTTESSLKQYKHTCIKTSCGNNYTSNDPDPYLCSKCLEEKNKIARQIDAKFAHLYKDQPKSEYAEFVESATKLKKSDGSYIYFMKA